VIDWFFVARSAVWIVGAAVCVASWSWHRRVVASPVSRTGAALFCFGLAGVSRWWEAVLWIIIGCVPLVRWKR